MTHAVTSSNEEKVPEPTYRLQYQAPAYLIDTVHLCFDLLDDYTNVSSRMTLHRNNASDQDLKLFGTPAIFIGKTNPNGNVNIVYLPGEIDQAKLQSVINDAKK